MNFSWWSKLQVSFSFYTYVKEINFLVLMQDAGEALAKNLYPLTVIHAGM